MTARAFHRSIRVEQQDADVGAGVAEVGGISQVEGFGAGLQLHPLEEVKGAQERVVQVGGARSAHVQVTLPTRTGQIEPGYSS